MQAYFFPNLKIFTFNLSSTVLYFSRNKHTLSHFVQGLKIPTKQIPTKQFFTSRVVEHTRGLPSKKLKLRLLQWESSASWMNHNVSESWRPMLVLFTLPENCPTTECFLVPFFSISEYNYYKITIICFFSLVQVWASRFGLYCRRCRYSQIQHWISSPYSALNQQSMCILSCLDASIVLVFQISWFIQPY